MRPFEKLPLNLAVEEYRGLERMKRQLTVSEVPLPNKQLIVAGKNYGTIDSVEADQNNGRVFRVTTDAGGPNLIFDILFVPKKVKPAPVSR